jgi:chromosomal replication initiation ATPase DnaA
MSTPYFPSKTDAATVDAILNLVSQETGVPVETIQSKTRTWPVVWARSLVVYLLIRHKQWSLPVIGRFLNMEHTTALACRNRVTNMVDCYVSARTQVEGLDSPVSKELRRISDPLLFGSPTASTLPRA